MEKYVYLNYINSVNIIKFLYFFQVDFFDINYIDLIWYLLVKGEFYLIWLSSGLIISGTD